MALPSDLTQSLAVNAPRDYGGSVAQNGFEFQRDWSIAKLLELHKTSEDYFMLFDYHEDVVVVLRHHDNPKGYFYQVKKCSTGKSWTIKDLVRSKKGKKSFVHSIIGKMRKHEIHFKDFVELIAFVTNETCNIELNEKKKGRTQQLIFDDFCDRAKKNITKALKSEYPELEEFSSFALYAIEDAELHPDGHAEHVLGKLNIFLDEICPERQCGTQNVYKALYDEVKGRCACEYYFDDIDELIKKKGLDRNYFEKKILGPIRETQSLALYESQLNELEKNGLDYSMRSGIKSACRRYMAQRYDASDAVLINLRDAVTDAIRAVGEFDREFITLRDFVEHMIDKVKTSRVEIPSQVDQKYLFAMVIIENEENIKFQAVNSESKEEKE